MVALALAGRKHPSYAIPARVMRRNGSGRAFCRAGPAHGALCRRPAGAHPVTAGAAVYGQLGLNSFGQNRSCAASLISARCRLPRAGAPGEDKAPCVQALTPNVISIHITAGFTANRRKCNEA